MLSSCVSRNDDPVPDPYPSLQELKIGFFRNGKILYSFDNADVSMFSTSDMIGIRMLRKVNNSYHEDYSCLEFTSISRTDVSFKNIFYTSNATKTISNYQLTNGQTLDLNGDEIWDVKLSGTNAAFSTDRGLSDVIFLELNNTSDISTTF